MFILNFRTHMPFRPPIHRPGGFNVTFNGPVFFNQTNNYFVQQNVAPAYNPYIAYNNPYAYNQPSFGGYGYHPYGYGVQAYQPPVTAFNYLLNDGRNFIAARGGGIPIVDPWMNGPQTVNLLRGLGLV